MNIRPIHTEQDYQDALKSVAPCSITSQNLVHLREIIWK